MSGNDFGFGALANLAMVGLVAIPLAVWKLVEIVLWLVAHVRIEWL